MSDAIRVLVVEDNPADAYIIERAIRGFSPDADLVATDRLASAREALRAGEFDVILLDLHLPDSEGVDTVRAAAEDASDVPIVVLTGADERQFGMACIEAGAHDYLGKGAFLRAVPIERAMSYALARRRQAEITDLQGSLERLRIMVSGASVEPEGPPPAVDGSSRARHPDTVAQIEAGYRNLLDEYLAHTRGDDARPASAMAGLIDDLFAIEAGPGDLLSVHLRSLEQAVRGAAAEHARAYAATARELAFDMMAGLMERYRAVALGD